MTQTISVEFLLCTRHKDGSVGSYGLHRGDGGDRGGVGGGVCVCVWGGRVTKRDDLVPALKCGKCCNEDTVKGYRRSRRHPF